VSKKQEQFYSINTEITPWNRIVLDKLTVAQLPKKFQAFYGIRKFIAVFTTTRHWNISLHHI